MKVIRTQIFNLTKKKNPSITYEVIWTVFSLSSKSPYSVTSASLFQHTLFFLVQLIDNYKTTDACIDQTMNQQTMVHPAEY